MKKLNLITAIALSFCLATFISCTTETNTATDAALTVTATDDDQASSISDQVISTADDYVNQYDTYGYQSVNSIQKVDGVITDSVKVTFAYTTTTFYPIKMSIDFGTGFTDKRGNRLIGKLYITISGRMNVEGSSRKFEFSNFFVNGIAIKGTKTVTFNGTTNENPSWTIVAKDTIVRTDGTKIIWNSNRTRTRIDNNNTLTTYWDDTYSIVGSSNGINAKGVAYTMEIVAEKPLIIKYPYKYFISGAIMISSENKTALLDYGNGELDSKATITFNGVSKDVNLNK